MKENSLFAVHDIVGIKLLTRLRLGFSHLNDHKFRHNFKDTVNPLCSCGKDIESTIHYLLRCQHYSQQRPELLNGAYKSSPSLRDLSTDTLLNVLLYGSECFNFETNNELIKLTIAFLKSSKRFENPLFS